MDTAEIKTKVTGEYSTTKDEATGLRPTLQASEGKYGTAHILLINSYYTYINTIHIITLINDFDTEIV